MWARPLLAAVAAGLVSFTAALAEERSASSRAPKPLAETVPSVTVAKALPASHGKEAALPVPAGALATKPAESASSRPAAGAPVKPAAPKKAAAPTLVVKINLSSQSMTLSYDGGTREMWKISSGRDGFLTPRGVFRPQWSAKMWYSRKYDNAPMPHSVFFVGGVAVHGTQHLRMLGSPASHGCVRLAPANAARLYSLVHKHGYAKTRIEVLGTTPPSRVAKRTVPTRTQQTSVGPRAVVRPGIAAAGPSLFGWTAPKQVEQLRRGPNGLIYLPPNSRLHGRDAFVHNGVVYRRVR